MKRKRSAVIMSILLLLGVVSMFFVTSSASGADGLKIGYVDLRVALNESDAGKKAKAELESMIKTKQSSIDEKGKTIDRMKTELDKQSSALSPDAKKAKEEEIERLVRDYQRLVQDSQNDVKKREGEVTAGIVKEIRDIVDKIGQEDGYVLILENVENIILFSKKELDISDRVVKAYNDWKAKQKK